MADSRYPKISGNWLNLWDLVDFKKLAEKFRAKRLKQEKSETT